MNKGRKRGPRPAYVRQRISEKLKGRPKAPETRAAMAASKITSREHDPVGWWQVYQQKLAEIQLEETKKIA